jgi:hypothetical protein
LSIRIENVVSENLTLVYDVLDVQAINSNGLRELAGAHAKSIILTPEQIIAAYPPEPTLVQIDERRVRIATAQTGGLPGGLGELLQMQGGGQAQAGKKAARKDVGAAPLWKTALACNELISGATLVAYGFNYGVEATLKNGSALEAIAGLVELNRDRVEGALDGELVSFAATPRLAFRRGQALYDLVLMPAEQQRVRATFNVHFEYDGIALPAEKELEKSYRGEFKTLTTLLSKLFDAEK